MTLVLYDQAGNQIDSWYIPESETSAEKMQQEVLLSLPVYDSRAEYDHLKLKQKGQQS